MSFVAVATGGFIAEGVGTAGSIIAGVAGAGAQQNIAEARQAQSATAASFAAPTAGEIDTLNKQISNYQAAHTAAQSQLTTLGNQITQTYGPNILQLGQQLHDQLSGVDSGVVQSASTNIQRQRQQLQQSLVNTMGPGALTSSAGIAALNNFDLQSTSYLTQLRQNSIGTITQGLSSLQGGESSAVGSINSINSNLTGMLNQIQGTQAGFQTRQYQAAENQVATAGAQYVGAAQGAQVAQSAFGGLAKLGGQAVGAAMGAQSKQQQTPGSSGTNPSQASQITSNGFNPQPTPASNTGNSPMTAADLSGGMGSNQELSFGNMNS